MLQGVEAPVNQLGCGEFIKSFIMLPQIMGSFHCVNGGGALAMKSLLTHNIPDIKLCSSKSSSDVEFFIIGLTSLRGGNMLTSLKLTVSANENRPLYRKYLIKRSLFLKGKLCSLESLGLEAT